MIPTEKIIKGYELQRKDALALYHESLNTLMESAVTIRRALLGNTFDLCTIMRGRNSHCSEDCAFCVQSSASEGKVDLLNTIDDEKVIEYAKCADAAGIRHFALVFVGRKLSKRDVENVAPLYRRLKRETNLRLCLSGGLLHRDELALLQEAGLERLHNNLETSRRYFPSICTTHTYDEKIQTIQDAQSLDIEVCSGGIFNVGETREDRVDLALTLRGLGIRSVPLNILSPMEGTPLADRQPLAEDEILRTVAIFRHILPNAYLRLAGGRQLLSGDGEATLHAGMNAAITGNFLNTKGAAESCDLQMIRRHHFTITV
ncbi:biotin synthase BioB [Aedoeadaptatus coxii]|uniref:biotin synthase BioB n=1 Tax=Aedoeadaptatus coxii TaxID=755172 RepID=UPI002AD35EC4|nr:biotin synthase BioB [Peptoniphilus coxii]